jgi:hypothetical protein
LRIVIGGNVGFEGLKVFGISRGSDDCLGGEPVDAIAARALLRSSVMATRHPMRSLLPCLS